MEQISHMECTGCWECENICPVDAITMKEDTEGFLFPIVNREKCIECGRCLKKCPAHHYEKKNWETPPIYAAFAEDKIALQCSSGGIFTALSTNIIEKSGIVFGARFDKNMQVIHDKARTMDELKNLNGSKYVQSAMGKSYIEVRNFLEKGTPVLFSGCPCQIAALNNFLEKEYDNLLTVDILCHGVPSNHIFQQYLNSISNGKKVSNVEFRNKEYGWNCDHIKVTFEDGTFYENTSKEDSYLRGFLKNLILRESCENCSFSEFPRVGDISIGDFWGIRDIFPEMYHANGTSIVFLNNKKGTDFFDKIKGILRRYEKVDVEFDKLPNRVHSFYRHHSKRTLFFKQLNRIGFKKSIDYTIPVKGQVIPRNLEMDSNNIHNFSTELVHHDIGLVCNYYAHNFGGSLTQLALYNVLNSLGYSVYMIEHPLDAKSKTTRISLNKFYLQNPYPEKDMAPAFADKTEMKILNDFCDTFLVGSDQLFQYDLYVMLGKTFILDWVDDTKRKIAYAASFGHDYIWGETKELSRMAHFMQKFDGFSVRENTGVKICKETFGLEAEWVLDPVFLCEQKVYLSLSERAQIKLPDHFIGSYLLDPNDEKREMIKFLMEKTNMECDIFSEFNSSAKYMSPLENLTWHNYTVEERLKVIGNCDIFLTDSFHGTCLSIIMRKPFISVINKKRGGSRFESLLEHFNLKSRLIETYNDIKKVNGLFDVDYESVYKIINQDKVNSLTWLRNKLEIRKNPASSTYNIVSNMLDEQKMQIETLRKEVKFLIEELGYSIDKIEDINRYLSVIKRNDYKYIIFLAIKDTPGFLINEQIANEIKCLGFQTNLQNRHWYSFIGIINGSEVECEVLSKYQEAVSSEMTVEGLDIGICSKALNAGNEASICINGKDYAVNRRGLNFVIWDKEKQCVIDSVCFDTHSRGIPCYR